MNAAFNPDAWSNFFVAEAGASAALTGLMIVAVSINLTHILKTSALSGRAAETVGLLTGVLVLATLGMVPGQPLGVLGAEFAAVGLVLAIGSTIIRRQLGRHPKEPRLLREVIVYGASVPPILAGVSLIAGSGGGLYWLVPGVVVALVGCVLNTWVLLVEILR
jgi:modulator of FtsH protease